MEVSNIDVDLYQFMFRRILTVLSYVVTIFSLTHWVNVMAFDWIKLKLVIQGRIRSATRTRNRAHLLSL